MAIQPLRGFRDFYPEDQANITYLRNKIAAVCALFGYEEFEGPALEAFDLYAAKSSDEIVNEQAFLIKSRGDDDNQMVLRPELTPTLARMVAAKQQQLIFPLRWWSFGRFWRYERPQKGRGREFYQWNLDLLGDNSAASDGEILEVLIRFFQSLGLTAEDVVFNLSDRAFINELLTQNELQTKSAQVFKYLDKRDKLDAREQQSFAQELGFTPEEVAKLTELFSLQADTWQQSERLQQVMKLLQAKGLESWLQPNLGVVRGFNYYTGLVFEANDRSGQYRALVGGGRYGNLVQEVGGSPLEGIGMGMGEMVLLEFLRGKELTIPYKSPTQACIVSIDSGEWSQKIIQTARQAKINTINYPTDAIGKGLKFANQKQIPWAFIVGPDEAQNQTVTVKNLVSGEQETLALEQAIAKLK